MEQRHVLGATEPVSEEELRALVERFGERQLTPPGQPTVKDVAETLQVEPETVAAMLFELRESKNQSELKERLDRLERDNAELRARTSLFPGHGSGSSAMPRAVAMGVAMGFAGLLAFGALLARGGGGTILFTTMIPAVLIVTLLVVFVAKHRRG